jgi:hypothetical protein
MSLNVKDFFQFKTSNSFISNSKLGMNSTCGTDKDFEPATDKDKKEGNAKKKKEHDPYKCYSKNSDDNLVLTHNNGLLRRGMS